MAPEDRMFALRMAQHLWQLARMMDEYASKDWNLEPLGFHETRLLLLAGEVAKLAHALEHVCYLHDATHN